jgi:hypothetical protein
MTVLSQLEAVRDRRHRPESTNWLVDRSLVLDAIDALTKLGADYELAFRRFEEERDRADSLDRQLDRVRERDRERDAQT